jgi:hypothetical protein
MESEISVPGGVVMNASALAKILLESTIAAWVRHNPHHDAPAFKGVNEMGMIGYRHIADELTRRGVKGPGEKDGPALERALAELDALEASVRRYLAAEGVDANDALNDLKRRIEP